MLLGIDHLVIAVNDPDAVVRKLSRSLGIPAGAGGLHPTWGTRNRLLWLGDTFIELLGITDPVLARDSWLGAPALAALRTGPALVGWAIATDDLVHDAGLLRAGGASLGEVVSGERRRPDGAVVRWRLALPPRIALDQPFLIKHESGSAEWTPDDRARRALAPGRLVGIDLPIDRLPGFGDAATSAAISLGNQIVVTAGASAGQPVLRIAGAGGRPRTETLLGCTWSVE
jgi:hypothetical protein